jgi:choline dehydrogenase
LAYPRGKAVGFTFVIPESVEQHVLTVVQLDGSSNLNAMAWSDSCSGAFEKWADEVGDDTFKFDTVSKYYRKGMNFTPPANTRSTNATPSYNPALVSQGDPLDVTYPAYANSWTTWVAVAMEAIGIKNTDSFINGALNGSAWHTNTINHTTGTRASADRAYLRPYTQRPNLALFNGTLAECVVFNDDKVATGVEVTVSGNSYILKANKEVIVAGGVFQSPQLLQVSGVGPATLLKNLKIPVVADRPGVGQNMNDQIFFGVSYRVNIQTGSTLSRGEAAAISVEDFKANATGFLTTPGGEYAGFEKIPQDLRSKFSAETLKSTFASSAPPSHYLNSNLISKKANTSCHSPSNIPSRLARSRIPGHSQLRRQPRHLPCPHR